MTATQASQPAKDPDDGAHGEADVDGTFPTDAAQAGIAQHGAAWTSATRLTYDAATGQAAGPPNGSPRCGPG